MKRIFLLTLLVVIASPCYAQNKTTPSEEPIEVEIPTGPVSYKADVRTDRISPTPFSLLQGRIILNKSVNELNLGGLSVEDFRGLVEKTKAENGHSYPQCPEIDIFFEVTNVSQQDIVFTIDGDQGSLNIELTGPGAISVVTRTIFEEIYYFGKKITLKPGKSHSWKLSMQSGYRNSENHYWTQPGEYFLQFTQTGFLFQYAGSNQQNSLEIVSPKIKITVEDNDTLEPLDDSKFESIGLGGGAAGPYGTCFSCGEKCKCKRKCEKCKSHECECPKK